MITKVSSQDIKVDFLYTLPRGGIAIHLQSKEDIRKLEEEIENKYPKSTCSIPLTEQNKKRVFMKNINPTLSTDTKKTTTPRTTTQDIKVRRSLSTLNLNALSIFCITCEKIQLINFKGLPLFGKHYACETYKKPKPIIRC